MDDWGRGFVLAFWVVGILAAVAGLCVGGILVWWLS